jgi:hypothetical protein
MKYIVNGVLLLVLADMLGFGLWVISNQLPPSIGYWIGKGTFTIVSIIIN